MSKNISKRPIPKSRRSSVSKIENFFGRLFLSGISVVIASLTIELLYNHFRYYFHPEWTVINDLRGAHHVPKPYVMFSAAPSDFINKLGYRGALPAIPKPKGEFRIFMVGGSALYVGCPGRIDQSLEALFQKNNRGNIKIFNLGIVSSVSRQELIRVLIDISGYEPDLIISYSGFNDTYDTGWDPRINYPHRFILYEAMQEYAANPTGFKFLALVGLSSNIIRDFFPNWLYGVLTKGIISDRLPPRSELRPLLAKAYIQNLRLTQMISHDLGSKFVSFYQPSAYFKNLRLGAEKELSIRRRTDASLIRASVVNESLRYSKDLNFYDLSDLFENDKREVFSDVVHYKFQWVIDKIAQTIFEAVNGVLSSNPSKNSSDHGLGEGIKNLIPEELFEF
jgi:hypothetical protein